MRQTWRWFGPADTISVSDLPQVGVEGVVSALHHIAPGEAWSCDDIKKRQLEISHPDGKPTGLEWEVVESLPVSEVIKTKGAEYREHIQAYRDSLRNLAACGLKVICYNFMPVLDWTRTNLAKPMQHGGTAMSFDVIDFAAFDLFILKRAAAHEEFSQETIDAAAHRLTAMSDAEKSALTSNIVSGLPGANESWDVDKIHSHLNTYADITADVLRTNLIDFLSEVTPVAEELGMRLCCHPDDPPFELLGLPRVVSTESDYSHMVNAIGSINSGITFCPASMGVVEDFDAPGFVERLGSYIHFAHLRSTTRMEPKDGVKTSFYESAHLEGDTDMVTTVRALVAEEQRRQSEGRADWQIPMRPDHGQDLLYDLKQYSMPGYPLIGRMRGLAELRGIMFACQSELSIQARQPNNRLSRD